MNPELLLSFLFLSFLLAVTPGPSNAFLLAQTFSKGKQAGQHAAIGFALGGLAHTTFAVLGLSALLAASPTAYQLVQWLGAGYLFYLGLMTLNDAFKTVVEVPFDTLSTERDTNNTASLATEQSKKVIWQAMLTEVLNPKVALFFIAFIPQFVDLSLSTSGSVQIVIFGLLYAVLALPVDLTYVHFGSKIAGYFKANPSAQRWLDGLTGLTFVALAINILR